MTKGAEMGFPFKRILVPVDFDESSFKALELAAKLAQQNGGTISVVHIVPVDTDVSGMPQYTDLIKRQESIDRGKLDAIVKQHLGEVKYEILDEMGPPAEMIAEAASRLPADLVVMVTHGRRGLARLVEGSIAERVMRIAPCPILAIRQEQ
jgi:nucleotide-binding universal stress UspA family protein